MEAAATTEPSRVSFAAGRLAREAARARASELFVEHGGLIERLCMALLRDRHEAEDAAQQAFLSAYRALLAGTEPREEAAWLATIARNECLQRIRARMRRPIASVGLDEEAAPGDVHRDAVARSHAAQLWQEIRSLPDQQRDAVILREFAGLSYEELAVALGITKPAVESLLFRARGRLRSRLEAAVASLNLAGAASAISDLVGRFVASGAAPRVAGLPVAAKLAAATFGIALVGGGTAVVTEQASKPHGHVVASASAAVQPAAAPATSLPTRVPVGHVGRSGGEGRPQLLLLASRRVSRHEGRDGASGGEVEHRGGESESGGATRESGSDNGTEVEHESRTITLGRESGDGGGDRREHGSTTTVATAEHSGSSGESGSGSHESGDSGSGGSDDGEHGSTTTTQQTTTQQTTTTEQQTTTQSTTTDPTTAVAVSVPTVTVTTAVDGNDH